MTTPTNHLLEDGILENGIFDDEISTLNKRSVPRKSFTDYVDFDNYHYFGQKKERINRRHKTFHILTLLSVSVILFVIILMVILFMFQ
jgi:hypothetical protein